MASVDNFSPFVFLFSLYVFCFFFFILLKCVWPLLFPPQLPSIIGLRNSGKKCNKECLFPFQEWHATTTIYYGFKNFKTMN